MRSKPCLRPKTAATAAAVLGLLVWGAWGAGLKAGQERPGSSSAAEAGSLIRKDLLDRSFSAEVQPRRNIFVRSGGPAVEPPAAPFVPPKAESSPRPAEPASVEPSILYVGYAVTPRQTVAIVLVNGRAVAVAQGDRLTEGYTVQTISPEALVLVDAQGQTRTISIRGEKS